MRPVNRFLLDNGIRIAQNPCVSPDFCLDWPALGAKLKSGALVHAWAKSQFDTATGTWTLVEDEPTGDCAWRLQPRNNSDSARLDEGVAIAGGVMAFPASWDNLLRLKNAVQEHDSGSTIFPNADDNLGHSTLGIGARFTTLHWPAVEWAMSALNLGVTANQNSIPRELVFDVDAMLEGRLDTVPFPFIGTSVPEGHQGQSVEGMSHGCVLSKLKTGFHQRRIAWSFNADHQPIGGKFDAREDALVRGCVLASYITFDLSPELAQTQVPDDAGSWVKANVPSAFVDQVRTRIASMGLTVNEAEFARLARVRLAGSEENETARRQVPRSARQGVYDQAGQRYLRELSIDELPGLTTPETTAAMLSLCEVMGMQINFVAPAFGFQKNTPYPDNAGLRDLIGKQWAVCRAFGASIGFHSGSGKSAENYQVMGSVTGGQLEIKTSGRYTYEMGAAVAISRNPSDAGLWRDWYRFTLDMAVAGAFASDATEQKMARTFITTSLGRDDVFDSPAIVPRCARSLPPSPEHMFFFEYNFLYVLAAGGRPDKTALGDHSPAGYAQRARFYTISPEARLNFSKAIAGYIIFLAENTGLATADSCREAGRRLQRYATLDEMLGDI